MFSLVLASETGGLAVCVPGEILGIFEAKKRFGNPDLSMQSLFAPTVQKCRDGFKVSSKLEKDIHVKPSRRLIRSDKTMR